MMSIEEVQGVYLALTAQAASSPAKASVKMRAKAVLQMTQREVGGPSFQRWQRAQHARATEERRVKRREANRSGH